MSDIAIPVPQASRFHHTARSPEIPHSSSQSVTAIALDGGEGEGDGLDRVAHLGSQSKASRLLGQAQK
jgi:hypothetical protein